MELSKIAQDRVRKRGFGRRPKVLVEFKNQCIRLGESSEELSGNWTSREAANLSDELGKFIDDWTGARISKGRATITLIQEWEGRVVEVGDTEFFARLTDLSAREKGESAEASIPLDELSDFDRTRVEVGALFRWIIGIERTIEGTRKRVEHIAFRDLPIVTDNDIIEGKKWADSVISVLNRE